ncbi:hypothetical protein F5Y13DRAFT_152157 [Hypoxylon sp. FL1857]|nr:hypothetical protein F5Y13DRAFT_152157 [Hypoxylon sp. FL1857]
MSHMSRNNSSTSLMGFSVHQPEIGAPLQFFPAMGSKQLDEMISAYVPGNAPIAEKRATVSMEFFEHTMATGELFKFFMVYPSLGSTTESPTTSMLDSGYVSNFTSPVMSESQWTQTSNASSSSSEPRAHKSTSKKASLSSDFSHLPGMKIMTRDGRDVTNSASRGCKTKEQRDHAHLMRIIKACDSCRRKKVRCDPSHRRSAGSSTTKTSKKTKKAATASAPSPAPPQPALDPLEQLLFTPSFDIANDTSSSFDSVMSEPFVDPTMDWDQFVHFDEEPTETIPYDYDFFFDPAGHLSPTSSNSFSLSQPITPAQTLGVESLPIDTAEGEAQAPLPPYLNPGGEAGNNYADFDLYSPGSSICLDDDPSLSKEVAAVPRPEFSQYSNHQRLLGDRRREILGGDDQTFEPQLAVSVNVDRRAPLFSQEQASSPNGVDRSLHDERISRTTSDDGCQLDQLPEQHIPVAPDRLRSLPLMTPDEPCSQQRAVSLSGVDRATVSLTRPQGSSSTLHEFQVGISSPSTGVRKARSALTDQPSQQSSVAMLTSGTGAWSTVPANAIAPTTVVTEASSGDRLDKPAQSVSFLRVRVRSAKLRYPQKSQPSNETLAPHSSSLMSYRLGGFSPSSNGSLHPTLPVGATEKKSMAISDPGLILQDGLERTPLVTNSVAGLTPQGIASPSALKYSERLDGNEPYSRQSLPGRNTPRSGALLAVLDAMAHYPVLVLALGVLFQWRLRGGSAEGLDITPIALGCLSIVSTYTKLWRHTIPRVDMLDNTTQPLSFLRRLPFPVTGNTKSGYCQRSRDSSGIQNNFEENTAFQSPNETSRTSHRQRILSLAW